MTKRLLARVLIWVTLAPAAPAAAEGQGPPAAPDLARASLEDLLNIEITSASRKEERADLVAAAVYVITQDDIRRSGLTTLPEVFRLAPGVQVARINASRWAISVRGFNNLYSNKLLVMIDGRSVYNQIFSGVFWDSEGLSLDDVERIEVIRGPGGSMWGANAMNGVINIITKPAQNTPGMVASLGGGTLDGNQIALRYGGAVGSAAYRVSSEWSAHGTTRLGDESASDDWQSVTNGARLDWTGGRNGVMLDGRITLDRSRPLWQDRTGPNPVEIPTTNGQSNSSTGNVVGRWTRTLEGGASLQVQSFLTLHFRKDTHADEREAILDVDTQYHTKAGRRHDIVAGAGLRDSDSRIDGSYTYTVTPTTSDNAILSAFLQDEIAIGDRVAVTLGSKAERASTSGWNLAPTGRVMWTLVPQRQHVWAGVSRAVRTPSYNDLAFRVNATAFRGAGGQPMLVRLLGNPDFQTETLVSSEAGYRIDVGSSARFDATVFRGRYASLATNEPLAPVFERTPAPAHLVLATQLENLLAAGTTGVEVAGNWTPLRQLRVDGSYSAFRVTPNPDAASVDPVAAAFDGNAPRHQWQVHSTAWLGPRTEIAAGLYYVGGLRQIQTPGYARVDARLQLKLSGRVSASITGQNLSDRSHAEFLSPNTGIVATEVPRSGAVGVKWRF